MADTQTHDPDRASSERNGSRSWWRVLLGLVLIAVGIPMLLLPGPGLFAILGGLGLVGTGLGLSRRGATVVRTSTGDHERGSVQK
jgi:uncharacterized membrane protein HdeD (DUF308 family)